MPKPVIDIQKEIRYTKLDLGLLQRTDCTDEENETYLQMLCDGQPLPEGIYRYENPDGDELDEFYRLHDPNPTEKELRDYLALKQYQELRTIRKCLVTLTVIAVVAAVIGAWILFCLSH